METECNELTIQPDIRQQLSIHMDFLHLSPLLSLRQTGWHRIQTKCQAGRPTKVNVGSDNQKDSKKRYLKCMLQSFLRVKQWERQSVTQTEKGSQPPRYDDKQCFNKRGRHTGRQKMTPLLNWLAARSNHIWPLNLHYCTLSLLKLQRCRKEESHIKTGDLHTLIESNRIYVSRAYVRNISFWFWYFMINTDILYFIVLLLNCTTFNHSWKTHCPIILHDLVTARKRETQMEHQWLFHNHLSPICQSFRNVVLFEGQKAF